MTLVFSLAPQKTPDETLKGSDSRAPTFKRGVSVLKLLPTKVEGTMVQSPALPLTNCVSWVGDCSFLSSQLFTCVMEAKNMAVVGSM